MCKDCIEKLNNCPICRNDSTLVRSLTVEKIVQRLEGIQPENMGPATLIPNLQKWGKGSVRVYGTSNGPNLQATPRQATPQQATPWQATPQQAMNNQDEEAALLSRSIGGAQSIKTFFMEVGFFFLSCLIVFSTCGVLFAVWYLITYWEQWSNCSWTFPPGPYQC
jgi:hypothetical protein